MRRIRMLGLCLTAALALAGLGGASSAAGATLCNVAMSPCPAGNIVPAPFHIEAQELGNPTFTINGTTIVCTSSNITDRILINPGTPITDSVISWTFFGCAMPSAGVGCTVTSNPSAAPLGWATRISTPPTAWTSSQGDFAVDSFDFVIQCGGWAPCHEVGAIGGAAQTIVGGWFNPGVPSPPKPLATPHAEIAFNSAVTGGAFPCGAGTFKAAYELTHAPFPAGTDLWLV